LAGRKGLLDAEHTGTLPPVAAELLEWLVLDELDELPELADALEFPAALSESWATGWCVL
jgi:hypothetical protein